MGDVTEQQDQLRQLASPDAIKNELVKQFTQHLEEPQLDDETTVNIKVVLLGGLNTGKSSWVNRVVNDKFNPRQEPTIGAAYSNIEAVIEDKIFKFDLWEVSGEEWCKELCPMYLQHAHVVIVFYDPTEAETFEQATEWVRYTKQQASKTALISLVGIKDDLHQVVANFPISFDDVEDFFVRQEGLDPTLLFHNVSNKTGDNAQDVILIIAETLFDLEANAQIDLDNKFPERSGSNEMGTMLKKAQESRAIFATKSSQVKDPNTPRCKSKVEVAGERFKTGMGKFWGKTKDVAKTSYSYTREKSGVLAVKIKRESLVASQKMKQSTRKITQKMHSRTTMNEVELNSHKTSKDDVPSSHQHGPTTKNPIHSTFVPVSPTSTSTGTTSSSPQKTEDIEP